MQTLKEQNKEFQFEPIIECRTAQNGIFDMNIQNLAELFSNDITGIEYLFVDKYWKCLGLQYKIINNETIENNDEWILHEICMGNIDHKMHIRVPVLRQING